MSADLDRSLALGRNNLEALLLKADLLLFVNRDEDAYALLQPAFEKQQHSRRNLGILARAAAGSGRREEARQNQQAILRLIQRESVPELQSDTAEASRD